VYGRTRKRSSGSDNPLISRLKSPSRTAGLCRCPVALCGDDCNAATYYLRDSRQKTLNCSGGIPAFFRIITSARRGGEGKLVQPGIVRGRILYRLLGGNWGSLTAGGDLGNTPLVNFKKTPVDGMRLGVSGKVVENP